MKSVCAQTTIERKRMLAHTLTLMVESKEPDTRRCCVKNSRHQMPLTWPFSTCSVCPVLMSHTRTVLSALPLAIRSLSNVTDSTLRTKRTGAVTHRPVTVVKSVAIYTVTCRAISMLWTNMPRYQHAVDTMTHVVMYHLVGVVRENHTYTHTTPHHTTPHTHTHTHHTHIHAPPHIHTQ